MATKPNSTEPTAREAALVVLTPVWIILAVLLHGLFSGEVAL